MRNNSPEKYREWKKQRAKAMGDTYTVRLICNNCEQDHYMRAKRGVPAWLAIIFYDGQCRNCGCLSFRKALFQ